MQNNREVILHLFLLSGVGAATIRRILSAAPEQLSILYDWTLLDWQHVGFPEPDAQHLYHGLKNRDILNYELDLLQRYELSYTTILDDQYPQLLHQMATPPPLLYIQGTLQPADFCVAMVGSRDMNAYGQSVVESLVPDLVSRNITIVSGGARGIDASVHQAVLAHSGRTIVVLGSGLLRPYPQENQKLFAAIAEHQGAVVSIFPLQAHAQPGHFPARNYIISGLSAGVIVVQAAEKSGALITAYAALEQGRDVFAVPGPIHDVRSIGCHRLIQQGAKLVHTAEDVLQEYRHRLRPALLATEGHEKHTKSMDRVLENPLEESENLDDTIIKICKIDRSIHDIMNIVDIDYQELQLRIFNLQLQGKLYQSGPGQWKSQREVLIFKEK